MTSKRSQPELKPKPLDAVVVLAVVLLAVGTACHGDGMVRRTEHPVF